MTGEIDYVLAGAATGFEHLARFPAQVRLQYGSDRLMVAVERRRVKAAIGLDYKAFELRLLEAIHRRFGLPASLPDRITAAIKMADRVAAFFEATQLAGFTLVEANRHFGMPRSVPEPLRERLDALDPVAVAEAQAQFLSRFKELHES